MASLVADLLKAAELGNIEQMVDLIEGGTAVNAETSEGWTPLIMASKEGHLEATSAVLTHARRHNSLILPVEMDRRYSSCSHSAPRRIQPEYRIPRSAALRYQDGPRSARHCSRPRRTPTSHRRAAAPH